MTKVILAALAGVVLLSGSAVAADLPTAPMTYKAPPAAVPVWSWTGFYLNAGGGYGIWDANIATTSLAGVCLTCATQTVGGQGYFGTAGGGFDYQFTDHIVAGVLADYNFMSLKGTIEDNVAPTTVGPLKENSAWAAGARIGWLVTPQILGYFNGGATGTRFGSSNLTLATGGPAITTTPAFTKTGWFLGGGTETTLAPFLPSGWFLRSEYRYSYFSNSSVLQSTVAGAPIDIINFKPTVQTISTSIVYKFNWMGH